MPKSVSRDIFPKQLAVGAVSSVIVISKTSVASLPQSSIADIVPVQLPTSKPVTTQVISKVNGSIVGGATTAVGSVTVSVGSPTPITPPKKKTPQLSSGAGATTVIDASQPPATDSLKSGDNTEKVGAISSTTGIIISIGSETFPHSSVTLYCNLNVVEQVPPVNGLKLKSSVGAAPSVKVAEEPHAEEPIPLPLAALLGSLISNTAVVEVLKSVQLSVLLSTKSVTLIVTSQPASTTTAVPAGAAPLAPVFVRIAGSRDPFATGIVFSSIVNT